MLFPQHLHLLPGRVRRASLARLADVEGGPRSTACLQRLPLVQRQLTYAFFTVVVFQRRNITTATNKFA